MVLFGQMGQLLLAGAQEGECSGCRSAESCPAGAACRAGVHVSLGFFEDVVIPDYGLPEPSFYKEDEKVGGLRGPSPADHML